jgi:multimeric flavodoxin WrbA
MAPLTALVLYWSAGGNTRRVAEALAQGLASQGAAVTLLSMADAATEEIDAEAYDLVCLGSPSYHFGVPAPVRRYVEQMGQRGRALGLPQFGSPPRPHKWAVVFVTYGGPHTGLDEATPAGDYMAQALRHVGRQIRGAWYTVGAFHGDPDREHNRLGWLGDIRGRPNEHDLGVIKSNARGLAYLLQHELDGGDGQG